MFWADDIVQQIKVKYADKIKTGQPIIIRDEKTASGRVHVGSLRGVAIHGTIFEVLKQQGIKTKYLFEINDFDPMDGMPVYLDKAVFDQHMGKPLCDVPSPDSMPTGHAQKAKNFAEFYAEEFIGVIKELGYEPEFYRSSELYKSGKYNDFIKIALEKSTAISEIYKRVSGSERAPDWNPVQVICDNCGKVSTTKISAFDGKEATYSCVDLEWTKGCGFTGKKSPFDGGAKLPWKLEWAAKWNIVGVDVEGGGKDHSTRGGSRDVADHIAREVFNTLPPFNIPYEFFNVGGKKMSSSKGKGSSSREMADLLPPQILRLLLIQKPPQRAIDFIPDGDTVPILYDNYDKLASSYFASQSKSSSKSWFKSLFGRGENNTKSSAINNDDARVFELIHFSAIKNLLEKRYLPRFSVITYMVQMPHIDIKKEITKEKGIVLGQKNSTLTSADKTEIELREKYAKIWLKTYAPEDYKFEIQQTLPVIASTLSVEQKDTLKKILAYIKSQKVLDGQLLHTELHNIRKTSTVEPKAFFESLYLIFLGKTSGPKAGWFFSVLDKDFVEKRLEEVVG